MPEKWLIAVDLDGTLFHTDHQISTRTLEAMSSVVELGHSVVVITGRSAHTAAPRLRSMPACARIVCSNGAYEYDRENQTVLDSNRITALNAVAIQRRILERLPDASFGWESTSGIRYEDKFTEEAGGAHTLEQGGTSESIGQLDLYKLFVRTPEKKGGILANSLTELFGSEIEVSSSGVPFVEITAAGTNKGTALAKIASELGFKRDCTIAFGDNLNDVPMLQWSGESVAMGNAAPELQSIANAYALSNAEDGVARYLENKFRGEQ